MKHFKKMSKAGTFFILLFAANCYIIKRQKDWYEIKTLRFKNVALYRFM